MPPTALGEGGIPLPEWILGGRAERFTRQQEPSIHPPIRRIGGLRWAPRACNIRKGFPFSWLNQHRKCPATQP